MSDDVADKEQSMQWQQPRPVEEWIWMEIELYQNGRLLRYGRVSWERGGVYSPSITIQSEHGLGLGCWPSFHALSDAQDFVEALMVLPVAVLRRIHGTWWPGVVV